MELIFNQLLIKRNYVKSLTLEHILAKITFFPEALNETLFYTVYTCFSNEVMVSEWERQIYNYIFPFLTMIYNELCRPSMAEQLVAIGCTDGPNKVATIFPVGIVCGSGLVGFKIPSLLESCRSWSQSELLWKASFLRSSTGSTNRNKFTAVPHRILLPCKSTQSWVRLPNAPRSAPSSTA